MNLPFRFRCRLNFGIIAPCKTLVLNVLWLWGFTCGYGCCWQQDNIKWQSSCATNTLWQGTICLPQHFGLLVMKAESTSSLMQVESPFFLVSVFPKRRLFMGISSMVRFIFWVVPGILAELGEVGAWSQELLPGVPSCCEGPCSAGTVSCCFPGCCYGMPALQAVA